MSFGPSESLQVGSEAEWQLSVCKSPIADGLQSAHYPPVDIHLPGRLAASLSR